ncbi:MAG TPA: histidine phosphatase family protein [Ohtaekwangia sp.]
MIRYLYLLRHAQSADKQMGQQDITRELTPVGVKEALVIGTYLFKQNTSLNCILTSVAERAKVTAGLIGDTLKFDPDKIITHEELYDASTRTFFQFITQLEDHYQHVMCVAHNPAISYLAEYLTRAEVGDMTPAGLAIIKFDLKSWKDVNQGSGELIQYITPAMLDSN